MTTATNLRREGLPDDIDERFERNYQLNIHLLDVPNWTERLLQAMVYSNIVDQYQCGYLKTYSEFIRCICEGDDDEDDEG